MATRMRRWEGFRPSRTSGNARDMITLIAYVRYEDFISSSMRRSWTWPALGGVVGGKLSVIPTFLVVDGITPSIQKSSQGTHASKDGQNVGQRGAKVKAVILD